MTDYLRGGSSPGFNMKRSDNNYPEYDPKKDPIELVSYDPTWSEIALLEIEKLRSILPSQHIIDIQHVGSTAIPGMSAKPVIDIQIAVDSLPEIKKYAIEALTSIGYIFWDKIFRDKKPDLERLLFIKGMPPYGEKRSHHVHIVEYACKQWQEKILFRDYLITHPEKSKEYAHLKLNLAKLYKYDREKYTDQKTAFVNHILELAKEEGG